MSKTGDRLRTLAGYWQPMGLDHTLMDIAKMADEEVEVKFNVSDIDKKSGRIATEAMFDLDKWADPKMYTHRASVLAADGKPLREGETVWGVNTGYEYTVAGFNPTTDEDGDPCVMVVCKTESDCRADIPSNCLTHERPDSWERIERDAKDIDETIESEWGGDCTDARDLVRRCRALAERGK